MYTLITLTIDIVLVAIIIYGYRKILHTLTLMHNRSNICSKPTQTRDSEYNSDISSDIGACTERTYDWIQDNTREKRTIFDTVLRLPENDIATNTFEKSSSPMPIVDEQVLIDSLRGASKEGVISRQPRACHFNNCEGGFIQQRINNRGPLF